MKYGLLTMGCYYWYCSFVPVCNYFFFSHSTHTSILAKIKVVCLFFSELEVWSLGLHSKGLLLKVTGMSCSFLELVLSVLSLSLECCSSDG